MLVDVLHQWCVIVCFTHFCETANMEAMRSCSNLPLQPPLKCRSTTWGTPRRTSCPPKRSSHGRARWWADTDCWPRRSWRCWRPRRQSPRAPRWSSWWFRERRWILGRQMLRHTSPRWQTTRSHLTAQVTFHKAHFVPCKLEVDGENKPDSPVTAAPQANSRGRCSFTLRAGKSGWDPSREALRCFLPGTLLRLSTIGALLTLLGGSLVRVPVSLHHGRFWFVQQHRKKMLTGLRYSPPRPKNIHPLWPRRTERETLLLYCKLGLFSLAAHSEAACTPLYSLWMQGKLVSAPLKTAHSCAGSAPGLSIPKQPAKRIQPEPRRQDRALLQLFLPLLSPRPILSHRRCASAACKLPPARPDEIISVFSGGLQCGCSSFCGVYAVLYLPG